MHSKRNKSELFHGMNQYTIYG